MKNEKFENWKDFELKIYKLISIYNIYDWLKLYLSNPKGLNASNFDMDVIIMRSLLTIIAIESGLSDKDIKNLTIQEKFDKLFSSALSWSSKFFYIGTDDIIVAKARYDATLDFYKEAPSLSRAAQLKVYFSNLFLLL